MEIVKLHAALLCIGNYLKHWYFCLLFVMENISLSKLTSWLGMKTQWPSSTWWHIVRQKSGSYVESSSMCIKISHSWGHLHLVVIWRNRLGVDRWCNRRNNWVAWCVDVAVGVWSSIRWLTRWVAQAKQLLNSKRRSLRHGLMSWWIIMTV